jgi:5-methylcytosine-specific restriction endonuclease McrA
MKTHRSQQHEVPWHQEEKLRELYLNEELSVVELAKRWGCARQTIHRALDRHEITRRGVTESLAPDELLDRETLESLYTDQNLSTYEIADDLECSPRSVGHWLERHGIERRERVDETHPYYAASGEDHPNWKGGVHDYGPGWANKRHHVLIRDQARCQDCGITEPEHLSRHGRSLSVHHLVPRRTFVDEDGQFDHELANRPSNLITVCTSCHNQRESNVRKQET